jgi:hypothetical protein
MATTTTTAMAQKSFQTSGSRPEGRKDSAVLEALDMFKQPAKARSMGRHVLPLDMLEVIKIAAGDQETTDRWAEGCREKSDVVRQSAVFFLQQTIAKAGDDKFRTLGLSSGAGVDEIRLHKRWLLKWLHPDRNPSKWETALFLRISTVANSLEDLRDAQLNGRAALTFSTSPSATAQTNRTDRKKPNRRTGKNLRGPVRQISWKNLLKRAGRRVLIATVLVVVVLACISYFDGAILGDFWSRMTES